MASWHLPHNLQFWLPRPMELVRTQQTRHEICDFAFPGAWGVAGLAVTPPLPSSIFFVYIKAPIFLRISFRTEVVIPSLALRLERLVRCHWKKSKTPTGHFLLGSMEEMSFAKPSLFVSPFSCTTNLKFPVIVDMMPNVSQIQRIIISCATKNDQ